MIKLYLVYKWIAFGLAIQGVGFLFQQPWVTLGGVIVHIISGLALIPMARIAGVARLPILATIGVLPLIIWLAGTWFSIPFVFAEFSTPQAAETAAGSFGILLVLCLAHVMIAPPPGDAFFVRARLYLFVLPLLMISILYGIGLSESVVQPTRFPYDGIGRVLFASVSLLLAFGMGRKPWEPTLHNWGIGGTESDEAGAPDHSEHR